jgi:hypothetical protein
MSIARVAVCRGEGARHRLEILPYWQILKASPGGLSADLSYRPTSVPAKAHVYGTADRPVDLPRGK